jgi:CelD/BcsL family acetyltransferase involved in cellulose biosynthesis
LDAERTLRAGKGLIPVSAGAAYHPPVSVGETVKGLRIETLRTEEALESLAGEWDLLVRAMPRPSPFLLHGWLVEWWRHYGRSGHLAVVIARRDGRLVGAAPLFVHRAHGVRVARFLGGHESALADLLIAEGEPGSTALWLLDEVRRQPFDYVDLFGLPEVSTFAAVGDVPLIERAEAPVLLMEDGWEAAYTAKTSSKRRNLHRRRLRQFGELGPVEFSVGRTREELEPMLEIAFRLHSLRWQGRPDGSTFGTEEGRQFHRAALHRLAPDGVLRIVLMRVDNRPVAFHYFFVIGKTMVVHRLGFDPELSRLSPGLIATLETLHQASEEGLTRVEFLGGTERYKLELADRHEPLFEAVGLEQSTLGALAARQQLASIRMRLSLKQSSRLQRVYTRGFAPVRRLRGGRI